VAIFFNDTWCIFVLRVISLHVHPGTKCSSIQGRQAKYALFHEQGNNRLDSLLLAPVVIAAERCHVDTSMGTHGASFSYGSFCSNSYHWRNPPASMITRSNIAVICDVGDNQLISFYWLLLSSPSIFVMESLIYRHVLYLFPTDHLAPRHTINDYKRFIAVSIAAK
jgi:hypothetical protein